MFGAVARTPSAESDRDAAPVAAAAAAAAANAENITPQPHTRQRMQRALDFDDTHANSATAPSLAVSRRSEAVAAPSARASAADTLLLVDSSNGQEQRFQRCHFLGKGGFARCYALKHCESGDIVAAKIVKF